MPKVAAYTLRWTPVQGVYELFEECSTAKLPIAIESTAWFTWLATASSFAFQGQRGAYTAHKEIRQRGDVYWYAYQRMRRGKLIKKYLGKTADLTITRLEHIASIIEALDPQKTTITQVVSADRDNDDHHDRYVASQASPDEVHSTLLATKLHIPKSAGSLVRRTRLTTHLQQALEHALTLVAAPAGFGKTTVLSNWLAQTPVLTAWVSLDSGDNEVTVFLSYILAALDRVVPGVATTELLLLQSAHPPAPEALLTSIINNLATCVKEIVLVLDDYHLITNQAVHSSLSFLLERLPSNLHLVLATRADPPLPLARMRVRRQLIELRTQELRFTAEEAALFFAQARGPVLSAHEITALEARTEGWIAGLQLAALSLQGRNDVASFITEFTGSHRHIVDYLVQEVLEQQSAHIQSFLMQTSILDRLHGTLCEAVTGQKDGHATLEWLEKANLFLVPLDDERQWFRYHQLFADMLLQRLRKKQPTLLETLHRRAACWFEQQEAIMDAITHLLAAGDSDAAALLVEQRGEKLVKHGDFILLLRWIALFPDGLVRFRLRLCLIHAEALTLIGLHDAAEARLDDVEHLISTARHEPAIDRVVLQMVQDDVLAIRILLSVYRGRYAQAFERAAQAHASLSADRLFQRGTIAVAMGTAYMSIGNMPSAYQAFGESIALGKGVGMHNLVISMANRASLLMMWGQLRRAEAAYRQALQLITADTGPSIPAACMLYLGMGDLLREWNDLDRAQKHLLTGIELGKRWGFTVFLGMLYIALARVELAQGDVDGALAVLEEGKKMVQQNPSLRAVGRLDAFHVRFSLIKGDGAAVERWKQQYVHYLKSSIGSMNERECWALVRVYLVQGDVGDALAVAQKLLEISEQEGCTNSIITLLILLSLIYQAQEDMPCAIRTLARALSLAEPEGYLRIFIDEGPAIVPLLSALWEILYVGQHNLAHPVSLQYLESLLSYLETKTLIDERKAKRLSLSVSHTVMPDLSERELVVLRLIGEGCSNREIAERLVVAVSTVKSHLNTLYSKLQVESRTQAIVQARKLKLLL